MENILAKKVLLKLLVKQAILKSWLKLFSSSIPITMAQSHAEIAMTSKPRERDDLLF